MNHIRALLFMPGDLPRYCEVQDTLEALQTICDGFVQAHPVPGDDRAVAWMNEEGKLRGMEANTYATRRMYDLLMADDYIAGPLLITGVDANGDNCDIPPELAKYMMDRCEEEYHAQA